MGSTISFLVAASVLIAGVVIVLLFALRAMGVIKRRDKAEEEITYRGVGAVARATMWIGESVAILFVIGTTIASAAAAALYAEFMAKMTGSPSAGPVTLGMLVGGFFGFVSSSMMAAIVLTVGAIERNTRHTAIMFERLANRGRS